MIKKIYYENFKGFDKSVMPVENLTTLIGTNASGKTNAIEGMMILSEIMTGRDLSVILDGSKNAGSSIRGGAKGCCRFNSPYFIIGCTVNYNNQIDLEYSIKINVSERIMVEEELLKEIVINNSKESNPLFYAKNEEADSDDIRVRYNIGRKGLTQDISCIGIAAVITQIATKLSQDTSYKKKITDYSRTIIEHFKNILFLNPETSLMRSYSFISDIDLKVNASNISSVLYHLCKDRAKKEWLLDIMKKLPENETADISFAEGPLNDVILFLTEKYGKNQEKIDAARLSDGTLRCLAIAAALLSEKAGGMLVIEEVDNGIHPGRAKMLIRAISSIAKERNLDVLITTHNAVLLNALTKEDLLGVVIVYRDKESGDSRLISLIDIKDMHSLLAQGKLGDVFTDDTILQFIKKEDLVDDYAWLGI